MLVVKKHPPASAGDGRVAGSILKFGRSLDRKCQSTPIFLPGNPTDRGAWWATVPRDAESDMTEQLSTVRVSVSSKQLKDIVMYML